MYSAAIHSVHMQVQMRAVLVFFAERVTTGSSEQIYAIFGTYMQYLVHIYPICELNSPHVIVRYDLGTVLARVRV